MFRRGDVFECYLSKETVGSEQGGTRPAVVIQNNMGNKYSPTVIVALITSQNKKKLPTHVKLHGYDNLSDCTVLLEQIRTVDKTRLGEYRTTLSEDDMIQIDKALLISQGININKLINKEN